VAGVPIVSRRVPGVPGVRGRVITVTRRVAAVVGHGHRLVMRSRSSSRWVIVMLVIHRDQRYIDGT